MSVSTAIQYFADSPSPSPALIARMSLRPSRPAPIRARGTASGRPARHGPRRAITSTRIAAQARSSGPGHHAAISSSTVSVIRVIVSSGTLAPQASAKCAEISPLVSPRLDRLSTTVSISGSRRWRKTGDHLRERALPIPRHLDLHRARGVGQHRLRPPAIAGVAPVAALHGVLAIAEVRGSPPPRARSR